jgi:2-amino-4-hydroxy-6-hydroxymethyldihydropteridine diphosphokinase
VAAGVVAAAPPEVVGAQVTDTRWIPAYVALGSNLDDPRAQVERAFETLAAARGSRLVARSSLYQSRPVGPVAQPDFVNAVAGMLTTLPPGEFLAELKSLEERLGRARPVVRWGSRRIDLDLLVHGQSRLDEPGLTVPHPGIAERAFVLEPLAEIAPDLEVPGVGRVAVLAARVSAAGIARIAA